MLLKERRKLIDSGTEHKFIKIRGNNLYNRNKLHGLVRNSQFQLATNSSSMSTAPQTLTSSTEDNAKNAPMETPDLLPVMDTNTNEDNSLHT